MIKTAFNELRHNVVLIIIINSEQHVAIKAEIIIITSPQDSCGDLSSEKQCSYNNNIAVKTI